MKDEPENFRFYSDIFEPSYKAKNSGEELEALDQENKNYVEMMLYGLLEMRNKGI